MYNMYIAYNMVVDRIDGDTYIQLSIVVTIGTQNTTNAPSNKYVHMYTHTHTHTHN